MINIMPAKHQHFSKASSASFLITTSCNKTHVKKNNKDQIEIKIIPVNQPVNRMLVDPLLTGSVTLGLLHHCVPLLQQPSHFTLPSHSH